MKPLVLYVDDEPQNLTVFEAAMPDAWDVVTYSSPVDALNALDAMEAAVIVSDQKMPQMTGVQFLELAKKIRPLSVRIVVTGFSDEDLVVQSVRKAQIFDYLKKPWDSDELESSLQRAIDYFAANEANRLLQLELKNREELLRAQNLELTRAMTDLEKARQSESSLRRELECWVPPFVLWAVQQNELKFPLQKDITGITFDIINSSRIHDVRIDGRPLRSAIIQLFSECIIRHNGWRESHSGDSAYGHFGLSPRDRAADAALAVANEFRAGLASFSALHGADVDCGIALHLAKNALVDIHTVQLTTSRGSVVQKSFDTTSPDIDLLHRIEKLVHELPGSNIIMSKEFVDELRAPPRGMEALGEFSIRGQSRPVQLFLMPSSVAELSHIEALKLKSINGTSA